MRRKIVLIIFGLFVISIFAGCHAGQEKAWNAALETTNQQIAENEFLAKNVDHIELERRQFIRVYIVNQSARNNFAKITLEVAKIVGDALFSQEGNTMKELTIFGNHVTGDELIVCKYTKEDGALIEKDRTMLTM